jgi:hypothetical protein
MFFHGNAIINRANKLAEIAANTFLFGPYLLLFPRREKSGAFVQRQTFCSSTSTTLQIQANKVSCDHRLCALVAFLSGRSGWAALVIIERQSPLLKLYPIEIFRRYTMFFHGNAAPISFSFPHRERAVLHYKPKLFVLPHQQHCNSKQIKTYTTIRAVC